MQYSANVAKQTPQNYLFQNCSFHQLFTDFKERFVRCTNRWKKCVFAVCILRYAVAAVQGQITTMKFARCLRKCFRLRESLNENNSLSMIKTKQGEVKNLLT